MTFKKKLFLYAALFYIIYVIFPLFADIIKLPQWLPSIVATTIMVALYPQALANKTFFWLILYIFVLTIYLLLGHSLTIGIGSATDSKKILIESAYILPPVCIFSILYYLKDEILTRKLVVWSLVLLFISFIVEIPLMRQYESLRDAYKQEQQELQPSIPGLPSYSLMHAYTLFLPVFCYLIKALSGRKRILAWTGLIVLCFMIYETFITTSLILMIGVLVFTIIYSDTKTATFFATYGFIFLLIYFLFENGAFIVIIDWIMPAFDGTPVQDKLIDFKDSMIEGHLTGSSISSRMDHHAISRNAFFENPIFGTSVAGGHSSLLDRLGGIGLFGTIPFIMIFISFIKIMKKRYQTKKPLVFFWVGVIFAFIYLYNKGNWSSENWLVCLVLMPFGLLAYEKETLRKDKR